MYVIFMLTRLNAPHSEAEFSGSDDENEETIADLNEATADGINFIRKKSFFSPQGKIKDIYISQKKLA